MAARKTRLAQVRYWRGVTQEELADRIGMARKSYQRLERGELANPPLGFLVNCAKALGVPLNAILEPAWLEWFGGMPAPPTGGFWPYDVSNELDELEHGYGRRRKRRKMPDWLKPYLPQAARVEAVLAAEEPRSAGHA